MNFFRSVVNWWYGAGTDDDNNSGNESDEFDIVADNDLKEEDHELSLSTQQAPANQSDGAHEDGLNVDEDEHNLSKTSDQDSSKGPIDGAPDDAEVIVMEVVRKHFLSRIKQQPMAPNENDSGPNCIVVTGDEGNQWTIKYDDGSIESKPHSLYEFIEEDIKDNDVTEDVVIIGPDKTTRSDQDGLSNDVKRKYLYRVTYNSVEVKNIERVYDDETGSVDESDVCMQMKVQHDEGSSKTKNVKGKKKKEKEVCENGDVESAATTTAALTTNNKTYTTEHTHLDDYVDVRIPKAATAIDGDDNDSGCGESGDKSTVEDRYEDHACQTDDAEDSNSSISTSTEDVRTIGVAVNACTAHCQEATIEKSFEDFGVQTDEETYDRPLLSSSIDEATLVQALRRKSESSSTTDLNLIDAILERNEQTIETLKTNYIKEYLNSTITTIAEDVAEEEAALQLSSNTHIGTKKEDTSVKKGSLEDEEEEMERRAEVSLESVLSDVESEGTSSYDEQVGTNSSESDYDEAFSRRVANGQRPVKGGGGGKVMGDKKNGVEGGVSDREFKPKILLAHEEEEVDSGTELRYDEVANKEVPTPTATTPPPIADYDYNKYVDKIKPLLYDAELVANLYIRLANKYSTTLTNTITTLNDKDEKVQHIHSAQIAYDVIKESSLTNFAHVVTHLLSYLGAIKAEKPIPENASVPNLLSFLEEMVKRNTMTSEHVTMMTCFLARPNRSLLPHHDLRMSFLITCFKSELSQLNVHTDDRRYLRACFIKLCEYFVQLDMKLTQELTRDYLLPHINDKNSTTFIMDTLTYMGLVKSEEMVLTTQDITAPLILLDFIFVSKRMSLLTSQKLYAFIQLNNPRFKFCSSEREAVANTLRKAIDF